MEKSTRPRKGWTIRELNELKFYAKEGLSIARVAYILNRTKGSISGAARRYAVRFNSRENGAPFGNKNAGKNADRNETNRERKLALGRERTRRWRKKRKSMKEAVGVIWW